MKQLSLKPCFVFLFFFTTSISTDGQEPKNYLTADFLSDTLKRKQLVLELTSAYFSDYIAENETDSTEKKGAAAFNKTVTDLIYLKVHDTIITNFLNNSKNGWPGTGNFVFERYSKTLDSILDTKKSSQVYLSDLFLPNNVSTQEERIAIWKKWISSEKNRNKLNELETENDSSQIQSTDVNVTTTVPKVYDTSWIFILVGVVLLILFLKFLPFIITKIKKQKKHGQLEEEMLEENIIKPSTSGTPLKINEKQEEPKGVEDNRQKIAALRTDFNQFVEAYNNNEALKNEEPKKPKNNEQTKPNPDQSNNAEAECIFLPPPYKENHFFAKDSSKERTVKECYSVQLSENKEEGKLILLESNMQWPHVFNNIDRYVYYACKVNNRFSSSHKKVKVIKAGKVVKDGEDWIVVEKVTVEFI